ncbi:MAG: hypothetical protein LWX07_03640 [Bacteroidetes bacterium]|nr:hypothetical protein [Bacteroidota bacterium]
MDKIIESTPVIISLIIAIIVAYIAYQQYKLAKFNTKKDLYERRLPVYKSVMQFISKANIKETLETNDCFLLLNETYEANFLFKNEVKDYIDILYKKGIELHMTYNMLENLREKIDKDEEYKKYCDENNDLNIWFSTQSEESERIFAKYLKIDLN